MMKYWIFLIISFNLVLSSCSAEESGLKKEWLFNVFPSMTNCVPENVYFDSKLNQSADRFMEQHEYKNPELDYGNDVMVYGSANYEIDEAFLGLKAIAFSIPKRDYWKAPKNSEVAWVVQVDSTAEELAARVFKATNKHLVIHDTQEKDPDEGCIYVLQPTGKPTVITVDGKNDCPETPVHKPVRFHHGEAYIYKDNDTVFFVCTAKITDLRKWK